MSEILKEELVIMFSNRNSSSHVGKVGLWTNHLQKKVMSSSAELFIKMGKSALQHTPEAEAFDSVGRCQCAL